METTIKKWGNSQGIRLSKPLLEQLGFVENQRVYLSVSEDSIIIKKSTKNAHKTLQERLESFYGKPIAQIETIESLDEAGRGKAMGEEIW